MAKFTDYTEKTEPVDTDLALIYDTPAKVNKKFTFGNLWKWIAKKIVSEGISQLETTNKTIPGAINELNSNKLFNDYLFYRSSGANIKSITISINKSLNSSLRYAPFVMFGGAVFLTGMFGSVKTLDASSQVLVNYQVSGMNEEVVFSNLPAFSNVVIIANYKNIATATVKEES